MKTFFTFLAGIGIGGGVAMLMTPHPGYRMRRQIKVKAARGAQYMKKSGSDLRDQAVGLARKGSDAIASQAGAVAAGWDAGRRAYSQRVNA
ncbi:MAG: hypothetical protein JO307_28700 [Bryobacterales bacterium]|nr:hypothetical protein [Bryobacterales bacterium]MBV9400595.1 hypothetical protein [Bryobacterales bacterium]